MLMDQQLWNIYFSIFKLTSFLHDKIKIIASQVMKNNPYFICYFVLHVIINMRGASTQSVKWQWPLTLSFLSVISFKHMWQKICLFMKDIVLFRHYNWLFVFHKFSKTLFFFKNCLNKTWKKHFLPCIFWLFLYIYHHIYKQLCIHSDTSYVFEFHMCSS